LLRAAASSHNLDLARSWLVGDRYCDIAAGLSAGARTILVSTGHNGNDKSRYSVEPTDRCPDLLSAAETILRDLQ